MRSNRINHALLEMAFAPSVRVGSADDMVLSANPDVCNGSGVRLAHRNVGCRKILVAVVQVTTPANLPFLEVPISRLAR